MILNRHKLLSNRKLLGKWGEKYSEKYLNQKGLKTLTRNFSCNTGELDIIMVDIDKSIVFVEVKTRKNENFVPIEQVITFKKKKRMSSAAQYFLMKNNIHDRPYRFDVVTLVLGESGKPIIRHFENAFVL